MGRSGPRADLKTGVIKMSRVGGNAANVGESGNSATSAIRGTICLPVNRSMCD
jgi:hypothetical protein